MGCQYVDVIIRVPIYCEGPIPEDHSKHYVSLSGTQYGSFLDFLRTRLLSQNLDIGYLRYNCQLTVERVREIK